MSDNPLADEIAQSILQQAETLRAEMKKRAEARRAELVVNGSDADETLFGSDDDDVIRGGNGTDNLFGEGGDDDLRGQNGDDRLFGKEGNDQLRGGNGRDLLEGGAGADILFGGRGEDRLYAAIFGANEFDRDYLDGGGGNDFIYGDAGDDTLVGGRGKDDLNGLRGADTYIFYKKDSGLGQRADIITDESDNRVETDRIILADTESDELIRLRKEGDNLVIRYTDRDEIMILNHYQDGNNFRIEVLEFADGTEVDLTSTTNGGRGRQVLIATDDQRGSRLDGGTGDDLLYAGFGNDRLLGGKGSDTYVFNNITGADRIRERSTGPDDEDTIVLAQTASTDYWRIDKDDKDLILSFGLSSIRIIDHLDRNTPHAKVEKLQFSDGVELDIGAMVRSKYDNLILGANGRNDYLRGNAGDDILIGFTFNDTLLGNEGADIYMFRNNDGLGDEIREWGDKDQTIEDRINLVDNETNDPIYMFKQGKDLVIKYANHEYGQDTITVVDQYAGIAKGRMRVELITLNDGKPWEAKEAVTYEFRFVPGQKTGGNDVILGSSRSEILRGGGGKDLITGAKGDDTLRGDAGGDTYMFQMGDGNDIIREDFGDESGADKDVIILMDVFDPNSLNMYRDGHDLVIEYGPNLSRVTVKKQFQTREPWWAVEERVIGSNFVSDLTDGNIYDFAFDSF
ncbi:MAG: hypothetical protein Alpg2KO_12940 [Alphaproteobacteria bacterium]